jgi:triosephosphate isomerase
VLIAGNWKMYDGPDPSALADRLSTISGVDVVVCPPFMRLVAAVEAGLTAYAQNVHWEEEGAFTGEISPKMLKAHGVAGTLVGHSERRQHFGETDETVARRAKAALAAGLAVIACVGETQEERDAGDMATVLRIQTEAIRNVAQGQPNVAVAYEPVWAIGTGRTATPETAQEAHAFIKSIVDVPVLYGGSVKPENAEELLSQSDVDGALVGGASLEIESFAAICETASRIRS